jgi:cobalamin biosynthesis protein CobD/CbiB
MRTYHPINWVERIRWHDVFNDKRFWGVVALVVFIALMTALVIVSAKSGAVQTYHPYMWPYGPYGPY